MIERTVTIKCIGNPVNGPLLGNATWKGFRLYELLLSLEIKEGASTVKYICADGYFTYSTLSELQNANVIDALYMNEEAIPAKYGFPLRIIFPGYYGVRQPGWIFWEASFTPQSTGTLVIHSRATARNGSVQPREDNEFLG